MIHNLNLIKTYPLSHQWLVNPSKLNLYSNTTVSKGDMIETRTGRFEITKCSQDSDITAEVRGTDKEPNPENPFITSKTTFYLLEVKEVS